MSLKSEQVRALIKTRDFLRDLLTVEKFPKTKRELRQRASYCLKHYPLITEKGKIFWGGEA